MTTFYLDPVNGNDSNDGTTFANRWKTLTLGATSARINAGDTIRVIKSPDPVSTGITATWTDGSTAITLSSPQTADITSCNSIWSGVANTSVTLGTIRNEGSNSASISILAGFTTGKAAYYQTGTLDLSSYQQVSFWLCQLSGTAAVSGDYSLCLCSDTDGNTPVYTIPIPKMTVTGTYLRSFTYDFGTTMDVPIQSIAFYVNVDRGATIFNFDNIIACLPPSSPSCITLDMLLGTNNGIDSWCPIRSIVGTTVTIATDPSQSLAVSTTLHGYSGTLSGAQNLYSLLPLIPNYSDSVRTGQSFWTVQKTGTIGNPITISGGWDNIDMSTKTGVTWMSGVTGYGTGLYINTGGYNYITVTDIGYTKYYFGVYARNQKNFTYNGPGAVGCVQGFYLDNGSGYQTQNSITATYVSYNGCSAGNAGGGFYIVNSGAGGIYNSSYTITDCSSNPQYGVSLNCSLANSIFNVDKMYGNGTGNFTSPFTSNSIFNFGAIGHAARFTGSTYTNAIFANMVNCTVNIDLIDLSLKNKNNIQANNLSNVTFNIATIKTKSGQSAFYGDRGINDVYLNVGSYVDSNRVNLGSFGVAGSNTFGTLYCSGAAASAGGNLGAGRLVNANYGGDLSDQRITTSLGNIVTDSVIKRTGGASFSWKFSPGSPWVSDVSTSSTFPLTLPLAKVYVTSGSVVTVSAWTRVDNLGNSCGIGVQGNSALGITAATMLNTAEINTWQQVTLTFTPTLSGVCQIYGLSYGTNNGWITDLSVS